MVYKAQLIAVRACSLQGRKLVGASNSVCLLVAGARGRVHGSVLLCIFGFLLVNTADGNNEINGTDVGFCLSAGGSLALVRIMVTALTAASHWPGSREQEGWEIKVWWTVGGIDPSSETFHWPSAMWLPPHCHWVGIILWSPRCTPDKKTGTALPPPRPFPAQ
jgi:hypothetical protein